MHGLAPAYFLSSQLRGTFDGSARLLMQGPAVRGDARMGRVPGRKFRNVLKGSGRPTARLLTPASRRACGRLRGDHGTAGSVADAPHTPRLGGRGSRCQGPGQPWRASAVACAGPAGRASASYGDDCGTGLGLHRMAAVPQGRACGHIGACGCRDHRAVVKASYRPDSRGQPELSKRTCYWRVCVGGCRRAAALRAAWYSGPPCATSPPLLHGFPDSNRGRRRVDWPGHS
jgi:hypothetical protein